MIEGTNDTEPHKKIWSQMGPEALTLAEEVYQARPGDIRSLAVYTDAYMYRSSAWGIVNAVVKGAADQYVANAEKMTQKFPNYDSGLGHAFMGAFYLLAPWPLSDDERLGQEWRRRIVWVLTQNGIIITWALLHIAKVNFRKPSGISKWLKPHDACRLRNVIFVVL